MTRIIFGKGKCLRHISDSGLVKTGEEVDVDIILVCVIMVSTHILK